MRTADSGSAPLLFYFRAQSLPESLYGVFPPTHQMCWSLFVQPSREKIASLLLGLDLLSQPAGRRSFPFLMNEFVFEPHYAKHSAHEQRWFSRTIQYLKMIAASALFSPEPNGEDALEEENHRLLHMSAPSPFGGRPSCQGTSWNALSDGLLSVLRLW